MKTTITSMNNFFNKDEKDALLCPVCGKMFKPAPEHAYYIGKNRRNYCCTYTCMRNYDNHKTTVKTKKLGRHGTAVRITETGETFESIKECARQLGTHYASVYKALMNGWLCNGYHIEAVLGEGETE